MNKTYHSFPRIKKQILSQFPITVGRAVCLRYTIELSHSVSEWLYERWLTNCNVDSELASLHRDMASKITNYLRDPDIRVEFIHQDPRTLSVKTETH
jgi:hypothetical protein